MVDSVKRPFLQSIPVVIVAGCLIAVLTFGPRSTMGFFLTPMTQRARLGPRDLRARHRHPEPVWGIGQPFVGSSPTGTARRACWPAARSSTRPASC